MPTVVLLGTLDTKGHEYAFLRDRVLEHGVDVVVVDAGVHEPAGIEPDVPRTEVVADVGALAEAGDRGAAVAAMGRGAAEGVKRPHEEGRPDRNPPPRRSGGPAIPPPAQRGRPARAPPRRSCTLA